MVRIRHHGGVLPAWSGNREAGYTLLEVTIVAVVLAIAATIVVPVISSPDPTRLERAVYEVADALRYARDQARHTSILHGVSIDTTSNEVRVFRLDESQNPNLKVYDVYHPVIKQLYAVSVSLADYGGASISALNATPVGTCNDLGHLAFDRGGVLRCVQPTTARFENISIDIVSGPFAHAINVDSYTGRVTVQ